MGKMIKRNYPAVIFILTFLFSMMSYAQRDYTVKSGFWGSVGIGQCYFGPTFKGGISYTFNGNIISIRFLKADELRFSPGGYDFDDPPLSIKETSVLYGISGRKQYLLFSFSAGIGYISGTDRGVLINQKEYQNINMSAISFPMELNVRIEITNNLGIGFLFFGNLNAKNMFYGGMIEACLGKFN